MPDVLCGNLHQPALMTLWGVSGLKVTTKQLCVINVVNFNDFFYLLHVVFIKPQSVSDVSSNQLHFLHRWCVFTSHLRDRLWKSEHIQISNELAAREKELKDLSVMVGTRGKLTAAPGVFSCSSGGRLRLYLLLSNNLYCCHESENPPSVVMVV